MQYHCEFIYISTDHKQQRDKELLNKEKISSVFSSSLFLGEKITKTFMNVLGISIPPLHPLSPKVCQNPREQDTSKDGTGKKRELGREGITLPGFYSFINS